MPFDGIVADDCETKQSVHVRQSPVARGGRRFARFAVELNRK